MKIRLIISIAMVALSLVSVAALAQLSDGGDLSTQYAVERGTASGGGYRLTGIDWQLDGVASGGDYHLVPASPTLRGNGCCCTYLPCILRQSQ